MIHWTWEDLFLPAPPEKKKFDEGDIRWKEVSDIVRNARSKSSPGPSGIPYLVYKRCPLLLRRLWKLLRVVWRKGVLPKEWMLADGCFIQKELDSERIDMFRGISLLSVELKIYLAVFAKRMTSYMIESEYLDTHVQKGGIPGQSGCIEHNAVVTQLVSEAKQQKGDLTIIWLDLLTYYHSIKVRFTTKIFTTTPQENYQFRIQGEDIPSLRDQQINCLGKWYRSSLNDQENVKNFITHVGGVPQQDRGHSTTRKVQGVDASPWSDTQATMADDAL